VGSAANRQASRVWPAEPRGTAGSSEFVDGGAAVQVPLSTRGADLCRLAEGVRRLPSGTTVALHDAGRGAGRRCRRFAAAAELEIASEYLSVPSLQAPLYLVENAPEPLRYLWSELAPLPFPPRHPGRTEAGRRLVLAFGLWRWTALALPQRIVIGRRL
jgi:hypothetical protein